MKAEDLTSAGNAPENYEADSLDASEPETWVTIEDGPDPVLRDPRTGESIALPSFAIKSFNFPGIFLRMDGTNVSGQMPGGGGTVNCQSFVGPLERFRLIPQSITTFAIASVQFPNVFLRMDGTGVVGPLPAGGGTVNCQGVVGSDEVFTFKRVQFVPILVVAFASVKFPGVFLRMDGTNVSGQSGGGGLVNCQGFVGALEQLGIDPLK